MAAALAHLSDGSSLQSSWNTALADAIQHFKQLLTAQSSRSWKRLSSSTPTPAATTPLSSSKDFPFANSPSSGGGRRVRQLTASDVQLDRRTNKAGDVFRGTLEVPLSSDLGDLLNVELVRAVLETPELRSAWDKLVEDATTLDLLDVNTKVVQTKYKLGWPASPRDSITIAKTFNDDRNVVLITTSLPRSTNEPAYLRPSPPHVRANVNLLAYCVQFIPDPMPTVPSGRSASPSKPRTTLKITCYWQWDPKGSFLVGGWIPQHMPSLLISFYDFLHSRMANSIPTISGYGKQVSISRVVFDVARGGLNVDYAIVREEAESHLSMEDDTRHATESSANEMQDSIVLQKDRKKLLRSLEFGLSASANWDVQLTIPSAGDGPDSYVPVVQKPIANIVPYHAPRLNFRISHAPLPSTKDIIRIGIALERTSGDGPGLRINGIPISIEEAEPLNIGDSQAETHLFDDAASVSDLSTFSNDMSDTRSVMGAAMDESPSGKGRPRMLASPSLLSYRGRVRRQARSALEEKYIGSMIKRNYIYFTSLLQEPEAKWNPLNDSRGVVLHQLKSIDPTVVVYRAESTVVGVGLWDVFATIISYGCRAAWDKAFEDAMLLEDVGECTELWQIKNRQNWPAPAREAVFLRTTYRGPESIHVFGLTTYDQGLFPSIPPADDVSRTRVHSELQGWSMELLSPNTVQVTLIEQYDNRTSSGKSAAQQALVNAVAGVGELSLKNSPPVITRLGAGTRALMSSYDLEKAHARFEYVPSLRSKSAVMTRLSTAVEPERTLSEKPSVILNGSKASLGGDQAAIPLSTAGALECEVRCDEAWSSGTEILIDPPPLRISGLRRHRLSVNGGGLWLTIEHDATAFLPDGVHLSIRREQGSETRSTKTGVRVNGSAIKIDVEDLPASEVQLLKKQKRTLPLRRPLDIPATAPGLRRAPKEGNSADGVLNAADQLQKIGSAWLGSPGLKQLSVPFSMAWGTSMAVGKSLLNSGSGPIGKGFRTPQIAAIGALSDLAQLYRNRDGETTESTQAWTLSSKAGGIERRLVPYISENTYTYRAVSIFQGFGGDDILSAIAGSPERKLWDSSTRRSSQLQAFNGITTSYAELPAGAMYGSRGFATARIVARLSPEGFVSPGGSGISKQEPIFVASASFDENTVPALDPTKYNPSQVPMGRILLEGWVLDELDAYASDNYPIPSTRVMYVSCVEYGGAMPVAFSQWMAASWPQAIRSLQANLKTLRALPQLRQPAIGLQLEAKALRILPRPFDDVEVEEEARERTLVHFSVEEQDIFRARVMLRPLNPEAKGVSKARVPSANLASPWEDPGSTPTSSDFPSSPSRTPSGTVLDLAASIRELASLRSMQAADIAIDAVDGEVYDVEVTSAFLGQFKNGSDPSIISLDPSMALSTDLQVSVLVQALPPKLRTVVNDDTKPEPRSFSVRIALDYPSASVADPLTGASKQSEELDNPALGRLRSEGGVLDIVLKRRDASPAASLGISPPELYFRGVRLPIRDVSKDSSGGTLDRRRWPRLRMRQNKPSDGNPSNGLSRFNLRPVAWNSLVMAAPPAPKKPIADAETSQSPDLNLSATEKVSGVADNNTSVTPVRPIPSRRSSLYDWWGMANRLGRPAGVPTTPEPSKTVLATPQKPATPSPHPPGSPMLAAPLATLTSPMEVAYTRITSPTYSPLVIILVAAAAFLLGSLVRGLLNMDEDFIMFGSLDSGPQLSESEWKVLRKIMGIKVLGWNVVLGAYRANQGG